MLEDGKVEGVLLDTYIAAEHKDDLFNDKIFFKEILDRPFGKGFFYQERQGIWNRDVEIKSACKEAKYSISSRTQQRRLM